MRSFTYPNAIKKNKGWILFLIPVLIIVVLFITNGPGSSSNSISEEYQYDTQGRLTCRITPDGSKIKYEYNSEGLLTEVDYPDDTVKYGCDANGNRTWMKDRNGRTDYIYDAFDRLTEAVFSYSPQRRVRYEYDPWNRISNLKVLTNSGTVCQVRYEYDILGRITAIDDGIGRIQYAYHPDRGEMVRHLPNGIKTVFSYSPAGELTAIRHSDSQNNLIASYQYEYFPPGKVSRVIEEMPPERPKITRYDWDGRGYLKTLHLPDGNSIGYEYDAMGNRVRMTDSKGSITYNYDRFGRLVSADRTKYEWDKNGNLITQIEPNGKIKFEYDSRNLPLAARTPSGTARYRWDGDGNMISRGAEKDITHYLPNPLAPPGFTLAEFDGTGRLNSSYLYGDALLGQRDMQGRMQYFLEDGFSSVRHVVDMNGRVTGQRDFTPFGEPVAARSGEVARNFRMAGERFLPELKKYFIGNRLYDPSTGRYLSPDPDPGYPGRFDSFNRYTHGDPDPDNFMEPRCNQTIEHQPTLGSIWQNLRSLPIGREKLDWPLNFVGRVFNLNWFGRNVTGGQWYVYDRDEQNQFSLGNTTIPGRNSFDMAARKHDIQYYINTHFDRGTWVQVPGPKGDEYFQSLGDTITKAWWTNIIVVRDMLLLNLAHHGGRTSLPPGQTAIPLRRDSAKSNDLHTGNYFKHGKRQLDEFYDDSRKYFFPPPPPPFGFAIAGISVGPLEPFTSLENELGGIKLDATAQFTGNLGNITGAVYDADKQVLVLVGNENISLPTLKPEDLAVALMCVYGPIPQDPQFSLDPADPKNPRGDWLKAVYIPEQVIGGTEFGKTLFEADWLLKQYSFGVRVDENGRQHERNCSIPGFKSTADLSLEEQGREYGKERWARFWIVSDDMRLKQSGNSIFFDVAKMRVRSRKTVPDPSSSTGLRDVDTEDDPVAAKFANLFTSLYDEIAKESPEFERVRQLAKAVAVAKWMKQEGVPLDASWVNEYANKRVDTIGRITALSAQREKRTETPFQRGNQSGIRTQIHTIHLFGGVDLTVKPRYTSDDGTAQSLKMSVVARLREKVVSPAFDIQHNGKPYRAVVLPVTRNGRELWQKSPATTVGGTTYQLNNRGEVVRSIDREGSAAEYVWGADHRLYEFRVSVDGGWSILGSRKNGYSEITMTNPRRKRFLYRYGPSGHLYEVIVDGQRYAVLDYREDGLTVNYANCVERFGYDNSGRIRRYETCPRRDGTLSGQPQVLGLGYDEDGNVTELLTPDNGAVRLAYANGRIQTLSTPQGKVSCSYHAGTGKIAQVDTTWGESTRHEYVGTNLSRVSYASGDYHRDVVFDKDGSPIEVRGTNGECTRYKYTSAGLLEQVADSTGASARYAYDNQTRIKTVSLPDGSSVNFQYESHRTKDGKDAGIRKIRIIHVGSKASSSPIAGRESPRPDRTRDTAGVPASRLENIKEAGRNLNEGLIVDLFAEGKDAVHVNIVDDQGNVHGASPDASKELRELLRITAATCGKLGESVLSRWQRFYDTNLSRLSRPTTWSCPDGRTVKIKPVLIIKSNEVSYKYANLEKVPVLADNFIIFIASKTKETVDTSETSAKDLVAKINNIPKLTQSNVAFIIRLPDMSKKEQEKWYREINNLQRLVGKNNVLVDPSKEELQNMLQNRGKDIVAFELTHTDKGILLKNGERYTSKDIKQRGDLSHIKYLISGLGTCNLPRLEDGKFTASLREKGVGVINASYREVSSDVALEKLKELINILRNIKKYDLYPYHLIDIIDQRLGISGEGTTNLGKKEQGKDYFWG